MKPANLTEFKEKKGVTGRELRQGSWKCPNRYPERNPFWKKIPIQESGQVHQRKDRNPHHQPALPEPGGETMTAEERHATRRQARNIEIAIGNGTWLMPRPIANRTENKSSNMCANIGPDIFDKLPIMQRNTGRSTRKKAEFM